MQNLRMHGVDTGGMSLILRPFVTVSGSHSGLGTIRIGLSIFVVAAPGLHCRRTLRRCRRTTAVVVIYAIVSVVGHPVDTVLSTIIDPFHSLDAVIDTAGTEKHCNSRCDEYFGKGLHNKKFLVSAKIAILSSKIANFVPKQI